MHNRPGKKVPKLILMSILWILLSLLGLVLLILIVIQFPGPQHFLTNKITTYVSTKINSRVEIGNLNIAFPKDISLTDLYVEDLHHDTLLYAHSIKINLNLFDLLSQKLELKDVSLEKLTAHIYREFPDTTFNYSFIPQSFSSGTKKEPAENDSTQETFRFSIKNVELEDIYLTYIDTLQGINACVRLGKFETDFDEFDLNKKKIFVDEIQLKNSTASIFQTASLQIDTSVSSPFEYDLGVKEIGLMNIKATYLNKVSSQDVRADIGKLKLQANKLDLKKMTFDLKDVVLSESAIAYILNTNKKIEPIKQKDTAVTEQKSELKIRLSTLQLKSNSFAYINKNEKPLTSGIDFNYLRVHGINMDVNDIHILPEKISLTLNELRLKEENGFTLKNFMTKLTYDDTHIELDKLNIQTDESSIGNYMLLTYPSLSAIKDSIGALQTQVLLKNTTVAVADVLMFKPDLLSNPNYHIPADAIVRLNCNIKGKIDDLKLEQVDMFTLNNTSISLNGHIRNVRDPKKIYADIHLSKFTTGRSDIKNLLNDSLLPANLSIPSSIHLKGNFKGSLKLFSAETNINTSFGDAMAIVKMNPQEKNTFYVKANIGHFDLGKLLNNKELGPLSMNMTISGNGLTDSSIHAQLNTTIEEAVFKQYAYKDLIIDGIIDKKSFEGNAHLNDKNLAFNYSGLIDLDSAHPEYRFKFDLKGSDLKALHLSNDDLRISAFIQSDLKRENKPNITGSAIVKNILVIKDDKKFQLDSILLLSLYDKKGTTDISLTSDMMNASVKGDITMSELPYTLKKHLGNYFDLQQKKKAKNPTPQKFSIELNLTDPTILTEGLVPNLEKLTPFSLKGMYDSEEKKMQLDLNLPQVVYSKIVIDSFRIGIHSNPEALNYELTIAEVSNPTLKVENLSLESEMKNNNSYFQLSTKKDDGTKMLMLAGNLKSKNKAFHLQLEPSLILDNLNWTVKENNQLTFSQAGIIANDLILKHGRQTLSVSSKEQTTQAPLEIKFDSFELQTLSKIIENKKELVSGEINGTVILKQQEKVPVFASDLTVKKLTFNEIPTGDIKLIADNKENPKKFNIQLAVTGNENNVNVSGYYLAASAEPTFNLLMDIQKLSLKSAEPYTFGQITQLSGNINGKLTITGTPSSPDVTGSLNFGSCEFTPKIIDSHLHLENEKIVFESQKIRFNSFTLIDSLGNKADLDGYVNIQNFKTIPFDIHLKTTNFLALNTTEKDNSLYFGTIYLDSDIKLKGTTLHPNINAKIGLNKGTVLTYVKPEGNYGKNESKGIVEFIDTLVSQKNIMTRQKKELQESGTKGITINAIIDLDKDAELKMLVDRIAGDSLYVKGGGQLEFGMDEVGKMNLTGKYRIIDGGYHLTINDFIKKNFTVAKGSFVTWSGDVTDPYVDIKAVYKVKASPVDLVQNELSGADALERNKYRTLMTFLVYLKMNGFISDPQISFDIQQPENERGELNGAVNAKLNELRADESQLNKQVFALLALNRFIGEDPLESGGAGGLESTSRASASRILTQQLNNLSEKYVKDVDLNLGVNSYEDYSSGQQQGRTQLELGVSKTILNDRVTVSVGGNLDVEGEKAKQNNASDVAGNIRIEYKLTEDGRYKLSGFRKTGYEDPIVGELIKTGFGVMYRRNYNKLKELLSKPKEKKKNSE